MKPHYYAFQSRLGLQNAPVGTTELNIGVEDGALAILTPDFLHNFPGLITTYTFPEPQTVHSSYFPVIAHHSTQAVTVINTTLLPDEHQIVIGGDHSVTFAALLALSKRIDITQVGYIQFDAHPDLNTIATSPSNNFHGMYLRSIIGEIGEEHIDSLVVPKLPTQNLLYIGNLHFDDNDEERDFLRTHSIPNFTDSQLRFEKEKTLQYLSNFCKRFAHIHISFDIDGLDESIAPATGIPCVGGLLLEDVLPLLHHIKTAAQKCSFDLVEVNPHKNGASQTIQTAQSVLKEFLQ